MQVQSDMNVTLGGVERLNLNTAIFISHWRKQKYVRHEQRHSHRTICCPSRTLLCVIVMCVVSTYLKINVWQKLLTADCRI
jgi:hypothetical protein